MDTADLPHHISGKVAVVTGASKGIGAGIARGLAFESLKTGRIIDRQSRLAREGCFDYLFVEPAGISGPLRVAELRLGRRTVLTFPLLPPPQKN